MTFSNHDANHQSLQSDPKNKQKNTELIHLSVRDQIYLRVFPDCSLLQEFITHLTGCPYTGQTQLFTFTVYHYIILYLIALFGGICLSWLSWCKGWIPLIGIGWILTLGGVSGCNFGLIHQASHGRLTGHKGFDQWFCRVIAVLICVKDFDQYSEGHITHHKAKTHQTSEDNTIKLLASLGIQPGLSSGSYWQSLGKVRNPLFLVQFIFQKRLMLILLQSQRISRGLAWGIWGFILTLIRLTQCDMPFLIAYVIPVIILFSPLFIIRHCFEHKLPSEEVYNKRDKRYVALSTDAIFLGEVPPVERHAGLTHYIVWTGWWTRMLLWHGMIRWTICSYDVPVHDYHTRMAGHPKEDSPNAIWHRQAQQEANCPGWPTPYTEVWGLLNAIDVVFQSFSQLPEDYRF